MGAGSLVTYGLPTVAENGPEILASVACNLLIHVHVLVAIDWWHGANSSVVAMV